MPMHDWTRVVPNDYHDFHFAWIAALRLALNTGILPAEYFAMAEHTAPPYVPDVLTLAIPTANGTPTHAKSDASSGGVATMAPPIASVASTEAGKKAVGRRRIAIGHAQNRQLVAVIEIVSPSNKASQEEFADLRDKSVALLRAGVHLLLIDPFPPHRARTQRDCTMRCGARSLASATTRPPTSRSRSPRTSRARREHLLRVRGTARGGRFAALLAAVSHQRTSRPNTARSNLSGRVGGLPGGASPAVGLDGILDIPPAQHPHDTRRDFDVLTLRDPHRRDFLRAGGARLWRPHAARHSSPPRGTGPFSQGHRVRSSWCASRAARRTSKPTT